MTLEDDIRDALNKHRRGNVSDTPDFILAKYLMECLEAFEVAAVRRQSWHRQDRKEQG